MAHKCYFGFQFTDAGRKLIEEWFAEHGYTVLEKTHSYYLLDKELNILDKNKILDYIFNVDEG